MAMVAFMLLSIVVVVLSAVQMFARVSVVQGRTDVPMFVNFNGGLLATPFPTESGLPPLKLESATIVVPQLSDGAAGASTMQAIITFGTITTAVICLALLALSVLRGRVFTRANTALITTAGMVGLVGAGSAEALGGTASIEAFDVLSSGQGSTWFAVEPGPYIIGAFAFAVILTAFSVGARMQRETEGLV